MGANPAETGRTLGSPATCGLRTPAGGRAGLQPQALAAALPGSSPGNGRPPAHPLAPGRGAARAPGLLTFSASRSFTVGNGVLVDMFPHFTAAPREEETQRGPAGDGVLERRRGRAAPLPHAV